MKTWGVEVQLHNFWPRYYMKVSVQFHAPAALSPGKETPVPIPQEASKKICTKSYLAYELI
jgi:hypothetical protein